MRNADLSEYMADIRRYPVLTRDQEAELARLAGEGMGDPEAMERLVACNLRLVVKIAGENHSVRLPLEDAVSEGNLGLMRAAQSFSHEFRVRFQTYASFWIKAAIRDAIHRKSREIRIPRSTHADVSKWQGAVKSLTESLGRHPTDDEVCEECGISEIQVSRIRSAMTLADTRYIPIGSDPAVDITDDELVSPSDRPGEIDSEDFVSIIMSRMSLLDEREFRFVRMRFGLDPFEEMSLRVIGEILDLTDSEMRKLQSSAFAKIAGTKVEWSRTGKLKGFRSTL